MASRQRTVDFIREQVAGAGAVRARKMFGEYGLYCDGKMVALICDDQLFIKPTPAGRAFLGPIEEGRPYPAAKPHLRIPEERWEDGDWLTELMRISAAALPVPAAKTPRAGKTSGGRKTSSATSGRARD